MASNRHDFVAHGKLSQIENFVFLASKDCLNSWESHIHSKTLSDLNELVDIKPKVVQDITAIVDRFPCQFKVASYSEYVVVSECNEYF